MGAAASALAARPGRALWPRPRRRPQGPLRAGSPPGGGAAPAPWPAGGGVLPGAAPCPSAPGAGAGSWSCFPSSSRSWAAPLSSGKRQTALPRFARVRPGEPGAAGSLPTSISSPRGTKKLHFVTVYHSGFFPYRQPLIHGLRPFRSPKIGEKAPFHKKFAIFSQFCPAGGGLSPAGGAPPPESPGAPRPSAPRAPPASVPTGPDRKGDLGIFARQKRENLPKTAAFCLASFRHPHYNISAVLIPRRAAPEILT